MDPIAGFLNGWEKVRQNVIATAEEMPEPHYDAAPFADMWSFRKQVAHVLSVEDILFDGLQRGQLDRSRFAVDEYGSRSRTELIQALEANFRKHQQQIASRPATFWEGPMKSFDGSEKTAGELLQFLKEHEIGHCNQMYVYLRAQGIVPPTTRRRAAQKAAAK